MQVGIVGLPNVGKSTLFKALTKKQVDTANYPFCTIDPNVGVVAVPDERLEKLSAVSHSEKIIPATIEFVDIAGLVKNAHKGEGLGNQFLANIREVDAIVEVIRDFQDENVIHVEGSVNPERDKDIIHLELIMADLATVEKRIRSAEHEIKSGDKNALKLFGTLKIIKKTLEQGRLANEIGLTDEEKKSVKELGLLTLKPIIYVKNIDDALQSNTPDTLSPNTSDIISINAKLEAELADLPETELKEYLKELNITVTGLDKLITASYNILGLITFLTSGPKETRAWTIKRGAKAPEAAAVIHTDFEKGFIRAEVCNWQDFIKYDGDLGVKEKGLMRLEGKDYTIQDGDTIYFRVST
ncbi:redox-regulated ATPase YchF [Candidatus Kuenenbacteria bacterium CG23_combo_of_CG06-09_8_20_14_all_36_9]|uniref:Ribosome-binding ATPase YchF n=1 Tax=Candidatus Kuenenbacteria bacterium CG10_big_fil_rev_8_21_14_0_10_36_11 TaxID=1974618 RepID=A0A2M6W9R1_9BACT|nr:MAG: redox-regulated ATPase YchF [Candidatus Kuenenbacteria bacterium CG23_combo_of_CG06-09_8_20_14_all_36_9]PIT89533.1 MAG: redox-regulated ATPase YchF [Candidatus Kuenenbacteria bacterium CG10_big_fil_rev_8_21_14_0_10_36_11]